MRTLIDGARRAGPYVLVEVLLPGGTLIALAMLALAHRKSFGVRNAFKHKATERSIT